MGAIRRAKGLRLLRLIATGAVLGAFVGGVLFALAWINVLVTASVLRRVTIAFLTGAGFAYAAVVIALAARAIRCGVLFWRARHNETHAHSPRVACLQGDVMQVGPRLDPMPLRSRDDRAKHRTLRRE